MNTRPPLPGFDYDPATDRYYRTQSSGSSLRRLGVGSVCAPQGIYSQTWSADLARWTPSHPSFSVSPKSLGYRRYKYNYNSLYHQATHIARLAPNRPATFGRCPLFTDANIAGKLRCFKSPHSIVWSANACDPADEYELAFQIRHGRLVFPIMFKRTDPELLESLAGWPSINEHFSHFGFESALQDQLDYKLQAISYSHPFLCVGFIGAGGTRKSVCAKIGLSGSTASAQALQIDPVSFFDFDHVATSHHNFVFARDKSLFAHDFATNPSRQPTLVTKASSSISCVSFKPESSNLLVYGTRNHRVQLFDVNMGKGGLLQTFNLVAPASASKIWPSIDGHTIVLWTFGSSLQMFDLRFPKSPFAMLGQIEKLFPNSTVANESGPLLVEYIDDTRNIFVGKLGASRIYNWNLSLLSEGPLREFTLPGPLNSLQSLSLQHSTIATYY